MTSIAALTQPASLGDKRRPIGQSGGGSRRNSKVVLGVLGSDVSLTVVGAIELLVADAALKVLLPGVDGMDMTLDILLFDRCIGARVVWALVAENLRIVLAVDMTSKLDQLDCTG